MPLPHLAKAPYMKADNVEDDDVVVINKAPWIVKAEDAKGPYKRDRAYIGVTVSDGEDYTWGLNVTTYERLLEAFGDDGEMWVNKKIRIHKEKQTIRGEERFVVFGQAYKEPQQNLAE